MLKKRKNSLKKYDAVDVVLIIAMFVVSLSVVYPFYNTFLMSIVPQSEYLKNPFMLIPKKFDFSAYTYVLTSKKFYYGFLVSLFETIFGSTLNMFFILTVAYAITKPFFGRRIFYMFVLIPGYIGGGMLANYLLMKDLNLLNSIWVLVLPSGLVWGYAVVVSRFICDIPYELEEAAKIDGASEIQILFKIIVPLSLPIIATYFLFNAVRHWNNWFSAMIYIKSSNKMPLQLILRSIIQSSQSVTQNTGNENEKQIYSEAVKMAAIMFTTIPIVCVYPFLQRFFISGATTGAVKG